MPTTDCSHCGERVDAVPLNETETVFDWQCPSCGEAVVPDGNAKEQQRQAEARARLTHEIQEFANELETARYEPAPYAVEELKERLGSILDDVESELDRRQSD